MLMHYHWGLGIGHTYSHIASTNLPFHSASQYSQWSYSSKDGTGDYRHGNEMNEEWADGSQTELDKSESDREGSEPDSVASQSDSDSTLGDHVDMYGSDFDALSRYEF